MPTPSLRIAVDAVDAQQDPLIALRRDLHAHPELAWQEQRTTALVAEQLEKVGVEVKLLPKSGLIAELGGEGPIIALRADLDALPVDDRGAQEWASGVDGVAHACGHDVHTSSLVGAGMALNEVHQRNPLPGRVRLMFQPAEEVMPGGALEVIAAGALDGVEPRLRPALRPLHRRRAGGPSGRPAHRGRRRADRAPHRARRPHLPART